MQHELNYLGVNRAKDLLSAELVDFPAPEEEAKAAWRGSMMPPAMAAKLGLAKFIDGNLEVLEKHGIVHSGVAGSRFYSRKGYDGLLCDAIRQLAGRLDEALARIEYLEEEGDL